MAERPGPQDDDAARPPGETPGRTPIVFVADASAEAERVAATLRAAGYVVVDVALSLLVARAAVQRPHVVLVDVDADGALDELARLRRAPGSGGIDFVFFGRGDGLVANTDDALVHDGAAFFRRPVDVGGLVRRVEALTGGPAARPEVRPSTPPPSLPVKRPLDAPLDAPPDAGASSRAPRGVRGSGPPLPMSTASLSDLVEAPRSRGSFASLSPELAQMLAEAEARAEVRSSAEIPLPSPEDEIEAVLPVEVLAALDAPIDGDDDDPLDARLPNEREGTGARGTTGAGTRDSTGGGRLSTGASRLSTGASGLSTGGGRLSTGASLHERRATETPSPARVSMTPDPRRVALEDAPRGASRAVARDRTPPPFFEQEGSEPNLEAARERPTSWTPSGGPSGASAYDRGAPARVHGATVLGDGDARRFFADAIARRATGALCFEHEGIARRVIVREGDLVTAASSAESETLVSFLALRGEIPRDEEERLAAKIPPWGRHAGAALVAHGWLRQDQLWDTLRAHAEWIAGATLRLAGGVAQLEPEPPGRLRSEPSVFGAKAGAEIFVELVRRSVPPDEAVSRLGGQGARIGDGANRALVTECNLAPSDLDLVTRARGGTLSDLVARASDPEIASVVHALALLGVLDVVPAPDFGRREERAASPGVAALDEEAVRTRIRARLELVEEGDYFAVLGVPHDATGYEIRRAFLELRRDFEPSRLLGPRPRLVDLADDVRKICFVVEEAYEILRDAARRERYRRAIEARPG